MTLLRKVTSTLLIRIALLLTSIFFLQTVDDQKKKFTKRKVAAADAARALYRRIARPDEDEFESILRDNLIRNCPITVDDANRALLIYGPDVPALKGTTHRSAAAPHVRDSNFRSSYDIGR